MDTETINLITSYLDKLGEKIGIGANYLWPLLVRQQYVDAYVSIVLFVMAAASLSFCFHRGIPLWDSNGRGEAKGVLYGLLCVLLGVSLFVAFLFVLREAFHIFNPEYWALKDLIKWTE